MDTPSATPCYAGPEHLPALRGEKSASLGKRGLVSVAMNCLGGRDEPRSGAVTRACFRPEPSCSWRWSPAEIGHQPTMTTLEIPACERRLRAGQRSSSYLRR